MNVPASDTFFEYIPKNKIPVSAITERAGTSITMPGTNCMYTRTDMSDYAIKQDFHFSSWNTRADGTGDSYSAGTSFTLRSDTTFYAQYKASTNDDSNKDNGSETNGYLDIVTTEEYSMKVGDSVKLRASWTEDCSYELYENEYDAILLSDDTITAETVGTATVKIISSENPSKAGYCLITVSSDSFSGTGLDYKLIGRWKDGDSYIQLNDDKTGQMNVYLNGTLMQDASFKWTTSTAGSGSNKRKYLTISDAVDNSTSSGDYLNKDYEIISVSETSLKLKGYLVVFGPLETAWTKE